MSVFQGGPPPGSPVHRVSFQRGVLLFQQGRYDDADREFRAALAGEPGHAAAHAMLALCLLRRKNNDPRGESTALAEATAEAGQAIGTAPFEPFGHYAMACVLFERDRHEEAELAAGEALRLDARNPDYFRLLGAIRFDRRRWAEALWAAEQGLAVEPDHAGCGNLRAMALVKLGRAAEAGAAIDAALARDPDNATTHANRGWTLLHQGDHRKALEHFREALRIDPTSEWARAGIVEALKARYVVYRVMLWYFLWMSRLSSRAQWAIIVGGYFGYQALERLADQNPAVAPYVRPVLIAYVVFAAMTWLADPLFNLLLRLNRFGRLTLSRKQTIASNVIGSLLLAALAALTVWLARGGVGWLALAVVLAVMLLPVSGTFKTPDGWPRVVMIVACGVLGVMGLTAAGLMLWIGAEPTDPVQKGMLGMVLSLFQAFTYGVLIATIGNNWLRGVKVQK